MSDTSRSKYQLICDLLPEAAAIAVKGVDSGDDFVEFFYRLLSGLSDFMNQFVEDRIPAEGAEEFKVRLLYSFIEEYLRATQIPIPEFINHKRVMEIDETATVH